MRIIRSEIHRLSKKQKANEIAYVFNDGIFLKIKTNERTFYFSLSDDKKQEWKKFIADRKSKIH